MTRQVVFFRPLCKSWNCPYCAAKRAKRWQITGIHGVQVCKDLGLPVDFVTITSHERLSAAASQAVLSSAWNKLNRRLSRAAETKPEYFIVPEQHQSGKWHLHAIVTARFKRKWWKDNARSCGFGFQSDVKEVNSLGGVSGYLTKYLTKSIEISDAPKGFRRVRLSNSWPRPVAPENPDWTFAALPSDMPLSESVLVCQENGFSVVMSDGVAAWDWIKNMSEILSPDDD